MAGGWVDRAAYFGWQRRAFVVAPCAPSGRAPLRDRRANVRLPKLCLSK
jgi:hypothetical protein